MARGPVKAHQRVIREQLAGVNPRQVVPLSECHVGAVTREQAEKVILEYEWLGTMPRIFLYGYGLFHGDDVLGVVCFGNGGGTHSKSSICGDEYAHLAVCLERGACVHYAHEHAASKLIAAACRLAHKQHGDSIFYAYSDPAAGEIGTVYQACNWTYLGVTGRSKGGWRYEYLSPEGELVNSRTMRRKLRSMFGESESPIVEHWGKLEDLGWTRRRAYDRSRYVWFEGSKTMKRTLKAALKSDPLEYPKR